MGAIPFGDALETILQGLSRSYGEPVQGLAMRVASPMVSFYRPCVGALRMQLVLLGALRARGLAINPFPRRYPSGMCPSRS